MAHRQMIAAAAASFLRQGSNEVLKKSSLEPAILCSVQCLSTSSTRQQEREAERAAKRARREAMAKKRAEIEAFVESQNQQQQPAQMKTFKEESDKQDELLKQHEERRVVLLQEASSLTLSLYRTCMRCVKVLLPGNEHDEQEFKEREEAQLKAMEEALSVGEFPMSPPVDRDNELSSRARYYHSWTRESFEQESDCLQHNPWRQADVERYLYFLRNGEYRRKWVLKEYKFPDPYPFKFDSDRVNEFEEQARELLRDSYEANGWVLEPSQETGPARP